MDLETFESDHAGLFKALRRGKGPCPDVDVFLVYLRGALTASQIRLLEEHLSLCAVCNEFLDRLQQSDEPVNDVTWKQVEKQLEGRAAPWRAVLEWESGRWIDRRYWMAAAACVVLAVGGLVVWKHYRQACHPPRAGILTRGGVLQLHEPAGVVSGVRTFAWSSLPPASKFRLQIRRQGQVLWEVMVDQPRYRPRAELSPLLVAGQRFEWRVAALDDDGDPVAESSWMAFEPSPCQGFCV